MRIAHLRSVRRSTLDVTFIASDCDGAAAMLSATKSCNVHVHTTRRMQAMPTTYVRHANEGEFQRVAPGTFVRDLGVGDITGGELTAQVVRIEPEGAYIEELHRHDEGFSLAYVLKGWLDVEFEEIGVQHLGPGTVIPAYNGPRHHELACGDGFELLLFVTRKSMSGDDRQRIIVQQERDAPYKEGLRDCFRYRDFGLTELTGGRMVAQAIEVLPGSSP